MNNQRRNVLKSGSGAALLGMLAAAGIINPGMALADSFGISGGDHAPWALPLYIASALALVAPQGCAMPLEGTGWPEPGGLLPREALNLIKMVSAPGLAGIEVVECSPPYDWAEQTALLSSRVILDSLAAQIRSGKLGKKAASLKRHAWGPGLG